MRLIGDDGILGARLGAALYQSLGTGLGVYLCLITLRQGGMVRWVFALLTASILTVWVSPYYKVYDHATSILIVALLVMILRTPRPAAWLGAGISLGVAAMMGRNHGVYGATAATLIIGLLAVKAQQRRHMLGPSACFVVGIVIGFAPALIMMLVVDGFAGALVDSIVRLIRSGSTNIGLPVPWPWSLSLANLGVFLATRELLRSLCYLLLIAFPVLGVLVLICQRPDLSDDGRLVFFAAVAASIPYAHYAFSRPDIVHLALGIYPVLIGLLALGAAMRGWRPLLAGAALLALSIVTVGAAQPYLATKLLSLKALLTEVDTHPLWVEPREARILQVATTILAAQPAAAESFLALPNMPSLYAMYRTRMPLWEIYSLFPRDAEFEAGEIKRLIAFKPQVVILSNHALDSRPDLRYSHIHPMIYDWIRSHYELTNLGDVLDDPDFQVYAPKLSPSP
jgi:hypothetical protein